MVSHTAPAQTKEAKRGWNLTDIEEYDADEWEEDEGSRPWIDLQGSDLKQQLDKQNISLDDVRFRVYGDYAGNICIEAQHLVKTTNPSYDRALKQYEKDIATYNDAYSKWEVGRNEAEAEWKKREIDRLESEKRRLED